MKLSETVQADGSLPAGYYQLLSAVGHQKMVAGLVTCESKGLPRNPVIDVIENMGNLDVYALIELAKYLAQRAIAESETEESGVDWHFTLEVAQNLQGQLEKSVGWDGWFTEKA